jgi:hypothetical protein
VDSFHNLSDFGAPGGRRAALRSGRTLKSRTPDKPKCSTTSCRALPRGVRGNSASARFGCPPRSSHTCIHQLTFGKAARGRCQVPLFPKSFAELLVWGPWGAPGPSTDYSTCRGPPSDNARSLAAFAAVGKCPKVRPATCATQLPTLRSPGLCQHTYL